MKAHEASEQNRANLDLDYQCLLQGRVSGPVCEYLDLLGKEHWVTCDPVGSPVESILFYTSRGIPPLTGCIRVQMRAARVPSASTFIQGSCTCTIMYIRKSKVILRLPDTQKPHLNASGCGPVLQELCQVDVYPVCVKS